MCFGRMECENQLFLENDMMKAFINGDLFILEEPNLRKHELIRKIILE